MTFCMVCDINLLLVSLSLFSIKYNAGIVMHTELKGYTNGRNKKTTAR